MVQNGESHGAIVTLAGIMRVIKNHGRPALDESRYLFENSPWPRGGWEPGRWAATVVMHTAPSHEVAAACASRVWPIERYERFVDCTRRRGGARRQRSNWFTRRTPALRGAHRDRRAKVVARADAPSYSGADTGAGSS